MSEALEWFAMGTGTIAAIMVSANMGRRITGYGFVIFVASSLSWVTVGFQEQEMPLAWQNIVLTLINLIGIYRWLILKADKDQPEPA